MLFLNNHQLGLSFTQRMKPVLLGLLGLVALASSQSKQYGNISNWDTFDVSQLAENSDARLTVPELITKYGYPVEVHNFTTEDGYILEAHRIPYGRHCEPAEGKRVVWLQHGLLGDSSNWVLAGPEKGLGYNLADACYDVWMGNYRGTTYSKKHVSLHPIWNKNKFWAFSWSEHGIYDLPASFDYVLNHTGVDGIYYVGHSMGTTGFFVCMSERPEYNSKIKLMSAYAPVAYTKNMKSPIRLIAPFEGIVDWLLKMIGMNEFMPSTRFMELLGSTACHQNSPFKIICKNVIFLAIGYNFDQLEEETLPTFLGHIPAGSSASNIIHFAQGINSGKFRKLSYGMMKNMFVYGRPTPPEYDISKITAPVAFYWGENDWLADKRDVARLAEQIPNLQLNYRVEHDKYNHFDFIWAKDNVDLLNRRTIEFMEGY